MNRLPSIDILRGLAIVVMALDHCRDYFAPFPHMPEDLSRASPALFLTRWATHFCAPVFVFLAGTSIFLRQFGRGAGGARRPDGAPAGRGRPGMSRFLLTRGLWLILLECTLIGASWGGLLVGIVALQVIWALGVSMLVMAVLVRLPWEVSLLVGLAAVGLHNLLDPVTHASLVEAGRPVLADAWLVLHERGYIALGPGAPRAFTPPGVFVVYPLIPWFGVMALGYAFGRVMAMGPGRRAAVCVGLGLGAAGAFVVLRWLGLYGEPVARFEQPGGRPVLAFLNTTKYPPSLQFLLMTLGPAVLAVPVLERLARGGSMARALEPLRTFGRVPLFFYVLHIPLIHVSSAALWYGLYGVMSGWQFGASAWPEGHEARLWPAYVAWAGVVLALYWPCRWFARVRERRRDWWLSYL